MTKEDIKIATSETRRTLIKAQTLLIDHFNGIKDEVGLTEDQYIRLINITYIAIDKLKEGFNQCFKDVWESHFPTHLEN
jgi:hypothetical protein